MKLTKTLDSAQITAAFLADVVTMIHREWRDTGADEVEVTITIEVTPSPNDTSGDTNDAN